MCFLICEAKQLGEYGVSAQYGVRIVTSALPLLAKHRGYVQLGNADQMHPNGPLPLPMPLPFVQPTCAQAGTANTPL
jgi:hypothetical protein